MKISKNTLSVDRVVAVLNLFSVRKVVWPFGVWDENID